MRYIILAFISLVAFFYFKGNVWPQTGSQERFQIIYQEDQRLSSFQIILDTQTQAKYFYCKYGFGAAMTPLIEKSQ